MSKRFWIMAVMLCMAILLSGAFGSGAQAQNKASEPRIYIPPPPFGLIEPPAGVDETVQPCSKGEDNRNSDLCAQWKAADAAKEAADWAGKSYWLGFAGTILGGFTLLSAGMAAYYAKRAAEETKRGADASDAAVAETRRIGEAQTRAYLSVRSALFFVNQFGQSIVEIELANSGQSPALDITIELIASVTPNDGTASVQTSPEPSHHADVAGSDRVSLQIALMHDLGQFEGKLGFAVCARVRYRTVFRADHLAFVIMAGTSLDRYPTHLGLRTPLNVVTVNRADLD